MTDFNQPTIERKKIIKALIYAMIMAAVLLVTAVLPAEYGIDPIGTGKLLGFGKLYNADVSNAKPASEDAVQRKFKLLKLEGAGSGPEVIKPKEADNPPPTKQYDERRD